MNLHQPRTIKRRVLFLGEQLDGGGGGGAEVGAGAAAGGGAGGRARRGEWRFFLNPDLEWLDVNPETKTR